PATAKPKTTKKHNARLNNPFPRAVPAAAFRNGDAAPPLSFGPFSKLAHAHDYPVGSRFRLSWNPSLGGAVSLAGVPSSSGGGDPRSRVMWETIPGVAFVSAASTTTEADECRGSFALRDGRARLVPGRQSVDRIRSLYRCDVEAGAAFEASDQTRFPVLLITGVVSAKKADPASSCCCGLRAGRRAKARAGKPILSARYWVFLEEKSDTQVSFSVKIADYQWSCGHADPSSPPPAATTAPRPHRINILSLRLRLAGRLHRSMSKKKKLSAGFPAQEEVSALLPPPERASADEEARPEEFNRVFLTYASERDERFYGFGEQFSCMEFKGRRVPVLVQEQGIGRGDQPITFAANLLSYRSGGNWSTTYAPSPFYLTSKMRSLYLEGYDYSIFDLTKPDRVQIQVYGNSVQGRILQGESPTELITSYTGSTGRPPVLPRWITSGAVVGMQGGTEAVRRVWRQLQDHDVPVSAFWLQDWVGQRKTAIGSQLWWNWEVDDDHYAGWKDLIRDLRRDGVRTMTYCNPCLVPMGEKGNARRHLYEEAKELGILVRDEAGEPYMMPNTAFDVAMLDFTNPEASSWFKGILRGMADEGVSGWMADFGEGLPLDARLHSGEDPVAAHNRYPELWARVNREFADEWKSEAGEEDGLVFFVRAGFRESSRWAMLFWEGDQMVSWQANDGIKSCQFYSNSRTLAHFARCAKIYKAWEFYRVQLVKEAAEKGLPVARHLFLHYPEDRRVQKLTYQQFLVGTEMLVVPVLDKGRTAVTAYFPTSDGGSWRHVWTGEEFGGGHRSGHGSVGEATVHGFEAEVSADVGCPAVFVRVGSPVGERFVRNLRDLGVI
uniref:Glycoside hydrolase family 31 N-terminal domain-containing protein n=1 Tax=Aegilops tauschii subsp. strangulata TaxID=200361 RepID=A0A453EQ48_AEGTS